MLGKKKESGKAGKCTRAFSVVIVLAIVVSGLAIVNTNVVSEDAVSSHTITKQNLRAQEPRGTVESYVAESNHPYANNYDYTWTITKNGASAIRVHFYKYDIAKAGDYMYVYSKDNARLAVYSGRATNIWSPWSNSDTIKVRLCTDSSGTKWGFKIDNYEYTLPPQNDAGGGTDAGNTLGDAVDNTQFSWGTGGYADWVVVTDFYYYGTDAAKSGTISHDQNTYIQATVTGPGTIKFYWKVASETNYDWLRFYIDGAEQTKISGSVDWKQEIFDIPSGTYTLQWKYTKDGSASSEKGDCGWLDKVEFTSGSSSKYAVIVGINDYQHLSDLYYCINDAYEWKNYLQNNGYTTHYLTNSQATENAIKNAIANARAQAGSSGAVAFIFAGHGCHYSEAGLTGTGSVLFCYEGSSTSGTNGNIQDTELQECFSGYTGKVFIFLDACRSGGMDEAVSNDPNKANRYMTTTCGPNGYGYDEDAYQNGAWTYWFLERGLVNGQSGHTDMEGNFGWAKNNYPHTGDDAPMQFDGNTNALFYL